MLADLEAQMPVDSHRLYASGFSNGANFTARLALERSTVFAAAAYSAGALMVPEAPARRIPLYMAAGSLDDRILEKTGPPPLAELPLNPVALLAVPVVAGDAGADPACARARPGRLRHAHAPPRHVGALAGASIRCCGSRCSRAWPTSTRTAATTRRGFVAAREFWRFFRAHPA